MCIWKVKIQDRRCEVCKVCNCEDRIIYRKKYSNLRNSFESLKKGESVEVSIESYHNYRSVLSRYNRKFDDKYIATKKVNDKLFLVRIR